MTNIADTVCGPRALPRRAALNIKRYRGASMPNEIISDLPSSRKDALGCGAKFYYTGKPCKHGHLSNRRASTGNCLECDPAHNRNNRANDRKWKLCNREKVLASEQKRRECRKVEHGGNKRYFTGIPCKNGHIADRFVSDRSCMACKLDRSKQWRSEHKEKVNEYGRGYVKENRRARTEYMKEWAKSNRDKVSVHERNSYALRKGKMARGKLSSEIIELLLKSQNCKCAYCRIDIKKRFHLDHILALSQGGSHELKNWQLLCPECNMQKGKKDAICFAQEKGLLL